MQELKIFISKNNSTNEQPINFYNKNIIQHELYSANVETVAWQHAKQSTKIILFFFCSEEINSMQVVKIANDLFSVQINNQVIKTKYSLVQMIEILTDFYSALRKKLVVENFSNNLQEYIREMNATDLLLNRPQVNMPNCFEQCRLDTKSTNYVDFASEIKSAEAANPKLWDWIKTAPKTTQNKNLQNIIDSATTE